MVRPPTHLKKTGTFFLRKHRKWPNGPFKPVQSLQQSAAALPTAPAPDPNHFSSLTLNPPSSPQAYHSLLKTLAKTSRFHQIPPLLDRLERFETLETPEYVFADLIKLYGVSNQTQMAVEVFYRIPKFRCVPSAYSLNALLSVLCRNRKTMKLVPEILLGSRGLSIRLQESSFRLLIKALCRIKKVGFALEVLNCMVIDELFNVDDKICSLLLLSVCEERNLCGREVLGLFGELRKLGFCPEMKDYTNLIRFLVKGEMGLEALDVLNGMKSDGIKPDIVCYTMVLDGVIALGDYMKASELFDELLVLGLVPDVCTYNVYIKGLCKHNNVESGIKMVSYMEELGCKPNVVTYNILVEWLYKAGELSRAEELLQEMDLKGIRTR